MGCEKYSGWLTDAALGGLPSSNLVELLAHMRQCDACREVYERCRRLAAAIDAEISAFVTTDPSPQFVARLRTRIDATRRANNSPWAWRIPAIASAVIVAAILAISVSPMWEHHRTRPLTGAVSDLAGNASILDATVARPNRIGVAAFHSRHEVRTESTSTQQPEILVPPGQLALVLQFSDAIEKRRTRGMDQVSAQQEIEKPLEIKAIVIDPMGGPPPIPPSPFSDFYEGL